MFSYKYDLHTCEVIEKSERMLEGENICYSKEDLDIRLHTVVVGFLSEEKEILRYTVITKPYEELIRLLKKVEDINSSLRTDFDYAVDAYDEEIINNNYRISILELAFVDSTSQR